MLTSEDAGYCDLGGEGEICPPVPKSAARPKPKAKSKAAAKPAAKPAAAKQAAAAAGKTRGKK